MAAETYDHHAGHSARFAMSLDLEDYFQVWAFSDVVDRAQWDHFAPRFGETTRACLDLFDAHDVKATIFALGWAGERDKPLIRDIVARGHELASHGYDHRKVHEQTRRAFLDDIRRTKALLEDIGGAAVRGYRAAGFSINDKTPWAYDALIEAGYCYSSSAHPIDHDHYGNRNAPQSPHRPVAGEAFIEAPVATVDVLGRRVSCAGGGWFRATPYPVSQALIERAARGDGPVIFYFHPWEIDADQPRIAGASRKSALRHYLNLRAMPKKLDRLLARWPWGRVDHAIGLAP